eukprot:8299575-Pyramimonas_sp.AAC.1
MTYAPTHVHEHCPPIREDVRVIRTFAQRVLSKTAWIRVRVRPSVAPEKKASYRGLPNGVQVDGVGGSRRIADASPMHLQYIGD